MSATLDEDVVGTAPYARCKTCDEELATPEREKEHLRVTFDRAVGAGEEPRSHTATIVNPTTEQRERSRARNAVDDALFDAFERLEQQIDRDQLTDEQIAEALWAVDVQDMWREWRDEGQEDGE